MSLPTVGVKYRVYEPHRAANQQKYVLDCLERNELTHRGETVSRFEEKLGEFLGVKHVIATCNGTAALYAAYQVAFPYLVALGDPVYVAVSPMTYAATVSQLVLAGFTPLYIDCKPNFQMDEDLLERAVTRFGRQLYGVVVPAVYANAPDMGRVRDLCRDRNVPLVEDAAEAFGCFRDEKAVGTFGAVGTFSFFANKVITTGEGGCLVTDDDAVAGQLRDFINHRTRRNYWHDGPGCNFRMAALPAAVGLAQLEDVREVIARKQRVADAYRARVEAEAVADGWVDESSEWMPVFRLPAWLDYETFRERCEVAGVETRPTFKPLHRMPGFRGHNPYGCPVAESLRGFILPCHPGLEGSDLDEIIDAANAALEAA